MTLDQLLSDITEYIKTDPLSPPGSTPILQLSRESKILIIGQAPGVRAQNSGIPWNDASGNRLREWLGLTRDEFYDHNKIAIIPMGFCFPGHDKYGGDKGPNTQHAVMWHKPLFNHMPNIKLIILIGGYAQKYYLKVKVKPTLTETIYAWREYLPDFFVLPHPSWRNNGWIRKNPWYARDLLPELRKNIHHILKN
ncbi:MAG: uracil-DNA glycosylase family protein [Rickettsiaceae bacterium]|jgi:uracil-DNA glycosylase|nr:uracil-DNA glycosylase family protein [Rickettsiaceae bacterium]